MRSILCAFCVCAALATWAQDVGGKTRVSQARTTSANIGKCDMTIKYHSPQVNGRKIFGGIIPYDFVVDGVEYPWRAGSNERTTMTFSHDVQINGQSLPAGEYGFVALVDEREWVLIFSSGKSWGAFNYDKANDILRVPVTPQKTPFQEWLSYDFLQPEGESVVVQLRWEETAVRFEVTTDAFANITRDILAKEEKGVSDYQELALLTWEEDPSKVDEALAYLEQSYPLIEDVEDEGQKQVRKFNYQVIKGEMLIAKGDKKEGKQLIETALASAAGFNIYYYGLRKLLVEGKKEASFKILTEASKTYPDSYPTQLALGEYYLHDGDQAKATEHFKKAWELSVEQGKSYPYYKYMYLQNKLMLERKDAGDS